MLNLPCPQALVLWWTEKHVRVCCFYCKSFHTHDIGSDKSLFGTYVALCDRDPLSYEHDYILIYPFHDSDPSIIPTYEIDKAKARFVAIDAPVEPEEQPEEQPEEESPGSVDKLASDLAGRLDLDDDGLFFPDDTEDVEPSLADHSAQKTIKQVLNDCEAGEVANVKHYLVTSSEADILIHGKDKTTGDTALIKASRRNVPRMLELLLGYGADIDAGNYRGRTALMEASLWGRAVNVRVLLDRRSNIFLKDSDGRTAQDLAVDNYANDKERRDGGNVGCEHNRYDAEWHRKAIVRTLQHRSKPAPGSYHPQQSLDSMFVLYSFRWVPVNDSFYLCAPAQDFNVGTFNSQSKNNKTIARLVRGTPFPPIDAMSGWSHTGEDEILINGKEMTNEVLRICDAVEHRLPINRKCDQGVPGKFNACHAEKQLAAYLLSKHRFLDDELAPESPLRKLYDARPGAELREATIITSQYVCPDCDVFLSAVERKFDIKIRRICADFEEQAKAWVKSHLPEMELPEEWPESLADLERGIRLRRRRSSLQNTSGPIVISYASSPEA